MVSLKELARICGVSEATVSLALRNDQRVKRETSARIHEVAIKFGYQPNELVRSLQSGNSRTIGVGCYVEGGYGELIKALLVELRANGYDVMHGEWSMVAKQERDFIAAFVRRRVDGLILLPTPLRTNPVLLQEIRNYQRPVVMVDHDWAAGEFPFVGADDFLGGRLQTEHLIRCGLHKIGVCCDLNRLSNGPERYRGFVDTMHKYGLPVKQEWCVKLDCSLPEATAAEMEQLRAVLSSADRPEGLVCYNDRQALRAMAIARDLGIRMPEELSLVGFGNDPFLCEVVRPRLTSIEQHDGDTGREAARLMLRQLKPESADAAPAKVFTPVELVVRDSVRGG